MLSCLAAEVQGDVYACYLAATPDGRRCSCDGAEPVSCASIAMRWMQVYNSGRVLNVGCSRASIRIHRLVCPMRCASTSTGSGVAAISGKKEGHVGSTYRLNRSTSLRTTPMAVFDGVGSARHSSGGAGSCPSSTLVRHANCAATSAMVWLSSGVNNGSASVSREQLRTAGEQLRTAGTLTFFGGSASA